MRCSDPVLQAFLMVTVRLEEEIARMKKNQERRLHRKNAKIVKEGGTPMTLNRPIKPDTTVRKALLPITALLTNLFLSLPTAAMWTLRSNGPYEYVNCLDLQSCGLTKSFPPQKLIENVPVGPNSTAEVLQPHRRLRVQWQARHHLPPPFRQVSVLLVDLVQLLDTQLQFHHP